MHKRLFLSAIFFLTLSPLRAAAQSPAPPQDILNLLLSAPLFKDSGITAPTAEDNGYSAALGAEKVFLFKGEGAAGDVWNIAIHRADFPLGALAGPASSALNGFQISEAILLVAPDANSVKISALPAALRAKLADFLGGADGVDLKTGIGLFSRIDAEKSSSKLASFAVNTLGAGGALKLTGAMDAAAFGKIAGTGGDGPAEFALSLTADSIAPKALEFVGSAKDLELSILRAQGQSALSGGLTFDFHLGGQRLEVPLAIESYKPSAAEGETYFKASGAFSKIPGFLNKIPGLQTHSLTGTVTAVVKGAGHALDVRLEAKGALHSKPVDFTVTLIRGADGKLTDYEASFHGAQLSLGAVPGLGKIPGAKSLVLKNPVASRGALGGQISFRGETVDAVLFDDPAGAWHLAFSLEKSMTLGEIIGHNKGLAKDIVFPRIQFILSADQVNTTHDRLPLAARNFFGPDSGDFQLREGVNIKADFDPALFPDAVKNPLAFIGVTDKLEIAGAVGGVFGGEPSADIAVLLTGGGAKHGFSFLKKDARASESFFLKIQAGELDLGIESTVRLPGGKGNPDLLFDVQFKLAVMETAIEAVVRGGMKGDWHNAAGIKGFTLENPFLSVGVQEDGAFDGAAEFGGERVRVAADLVILPEAAFLPEAMALAGEIKTINFDQLSAHGGRFAKAKHGKGLQHGGFKGAKAEFRDVAFAFMTPGAHLPADLQEELKIEGAGIALRGTLLINGKEVGKISGYASDEGLNFDGKLDPFKLGPLELKEAQLDVTASVAAPPSFKISGDIRLFKGFEDQFRLEMMPSHFEFYTDTKFGGLFDVSLDAKTTHGLSFSPENDFTFDAELSADYAKAFTAVIDGAIKGLKKGDSDIKNAQSKVAAAQRKVDGLKKQIADSKAADKRNYDKAKAGIDGAERKVEGLSAQIDSHKHDIAHYKSESKHYGSIKHFNPVKGAKADAKIVQLGTELTGLYAAYGTAKGVLEAAKKTAQASIEGISPKTRSLQAALATEQAGLDAAAGVLEAARRTDKGLQAASQALLSAGGGFKIDGISVAGSLHGITSGGRTGKAPVLKVRAEIAGQKHTYVAAAGGAEREFKKIVAHIAAEAAQALVKALTPKN